MPNNKYKQLLPFSLVHKRDKLLQLRFHFNLYSFISLVAFRHYVAGLNIHSVIHGRMIVEVLSFATVAIVPIIGTFPY